MSIIVKICVKNREITNLIVQQRISYGFSPEVRLLLVAYVSKLFKNTLRALRIIGFCVVVSYTCVARQHKLVELYRYSQNKKDTNSVSLIAYERNLLISYCHYTSIAIIENT